MATEAEGGRLHIRLLGEFALSVAGTAVAGLNADRPQSLLAYLLLHREAPQSRQHLAFLLWPDSDEGQARTNLRNLLHTLRRTLPEADRFIAADTTTLQWRPDAPFTLDVALFEGALAAARATDNAALLLTHLETAVACYRGDLLPGNYDDWLIPLREELRRQCLDALNRLAALLESQGAYRRAARYGAQLLRHDPLDETAAVQLMRLHALSGDRAGVRRVYQGLTAVLRRELDVDPAPATQAAYSELLRLEAAPQRPAAPAPRPARAPRPLPVPPTPFIGRQAALEAIADRLADPECRLLTIVGLGGMGKTRLALQTAIDHREKFADGVAFVPLAPLQTTELLVAAVADGVQFAFSGLGEPRVQLVNYLSGRRMLLVLDNFEQLLSPRAEGESSGAEQWLAELLQRAPKLKLLVTSRQRLALQEEWVYELDGLVIPDSLGSPEWATTGAVALFLQSAGRADARFSLTPENGPDILRICHLVGGMPLGIELAASWVNLLSCAEIADEIARGVTLLTYDARNVPERHRSIETVITHSWQYLTPREQQVMSRLALFQGGFTREAAEAVAGADLAVLSALVGKSLLQRTVTGRFTLHELVRQYGLARLQESGDDESAVRHATFYLSLLAEHESRLQSAGQKRAMATLAAENDNIRAAWETAVDREQWDILKRAACTFWYFYELRNYFQEGIERLARTSERLKAVLDAATTDTAQKAALRHLESELQAYRGFFNIHLGEARKALEYTASAVASLRPLGDSRALAYALSLHVLIVRTLDDSDVASGLCEEGLLLSRATGQRWQEAIFLATLGAAHHDRGRYEEGYALLKEALAVSQALGDPRHMAYIGNLYSRTAQILGRPGEVQELLLELLALCREIDDRLGMGMTMEQLARAAEIGGDGERAYRYYQECIALYADSGDAYHLAQALNLLGNFQLQSGDSYEARATFAWAYEVAEGMGVVPTMLNALLGLATLASCSREEGGAWPERERPGRALELARAIAGHPACPPDTRERSSALVARLAAQLGHGISASAADSRERPFEAIIPEWVVYGRSIPNTASNSPTTTSRLSGRRNGASLLTR